MVAAESYVKGVILCLPCEDRDIYLDSQLQFV